MKDALTAREITEKNKALAMDYITAAGRKQFERVRRFLHDELTFKAPMQTLFQTADDYLVTLKDHEGSLLRNDIKAVFADLDEVCIVYDAVTNTELGAVPCVQWIKVREDRIASIRLLIHLPGS